MTHETSQDRRLSTPARRRFAFLPSAVRLVCHAPRALAVAALAAPLAFTGCGIIAGQAVSTALGSTRSVQVNPSTVSLLPGAQQLFTERSTKVIGSTGSDHPSWSVETPSGQTPVGFIDQNGLFTATDQGQGTVRADVNTGAGAVHLDGRATVFVTTDPNAPVVGPVTLSPASGSLGSTVEITAPVSDPQGLSDIQRVSVREQTTGLTADLVDDGLHGGDVTAHDGIYSARITLPPTIQLPSLRFGVYAVDFEGHPSNWSWQTFVVK